MSRSIGIDVGGTKILGAVVDADRPVEPVVERRVPTPKGSADALVTAIAELAAELSELTVRGGGGPPTTMGVGLPGLIGRDGVLRMGPHLPGLIDVPLADMVAEATSLPVVAANDASCAALAEHAMGAGRGRDNVVVITLGTGIGCGLIVDGRLALGAHGFAGEPGHMILEPGGPPCPCGKAGCWEQFASGGGLGRMGREAAAVGKVALSVELAGGDPTALLGEHVTAAALRDDEDALEIVAEFSKWLALGLANVANVLDPELIVLGGGVLPASTLFLSDTRDWFDQLVMAGAHRPLVHIERAELGERAGAIGAALLPVSTALRDEVGRHA